VSVLERSLQRMAVALFPIFVPHAAAGARWCRSGMHLPPDAREKKLLARLRQLIRGFRSRGLCREPDFDRYKELRSFADLAGLPVLTKSGLIKLYPALEETYAGRSDVYSRRTGGSTGEPASHLRDRKLASFSIGGLVVMLEIMGWRPGTPRFCLWGRDDEVGMAGKSPRTIKSLLSQVWGFCDYAQGERQIRRFYEAVRDNPGCAVYGFTSMLEECSRVMLEKGWTLEPGHVLAAWGGAEMVFPHQRTIFERAFGAPLNFFYGSREFASIAAECAQGNWHINARYILEAVDPEDYAPLAPGEPGSLLITDLANTITPFSRYEIGDFGAVAWRECACGRRGPCLVDLRGRIHEMIPLLSGKKVHTIFFNYLFNEYPAVQRTQVIRNGIADFEIRYVGGALDEQSRSLIIQEARKMLDNALVSLTRTDRLDRSRSGKLVQYFDNSQ